MAKDVTGPRGMRDFLPHDKAHREYVLSKIVGTYARHGFTQIETPVMEDISRLTAGMGGDNEKLAFRVMRRGITETDLARAASENTPGILSDLGLRYDLTVPLARFYATNRAKLPRVFKSIQAAPVWRAERPQKGRYRQFMQCDIDIIGEQGNLAEVELLAATGQTLAELGLTGASVRINDRRLLDVLLAQCGFAAEDAPRVLISVDKLDKIGVDGVIAELTENGFARQAPALEQYLNGFASQAPYAVTDEDLRRALPGLFDTEEPTLATAASANLREIANAVGALDMAPTLVFDPTLVRGMGYYTGTIFEIALPEGGSSVGGGGRYDGMVGRFLGQDVPACGISIGFERVVDLVEPQAENRQAAITLIYEKQGEPRHLLAIKQQLIDQGYRVRLEQKPKKVAPLISSLAAEGFGQFAFVGTDAVSSEDLEIRQA